MTARTLVIKTTAGADAPECCAQAFTVAATAAGQELSLDAPTITGTPPFPL